MTQFFKSNYAEVSDEIKQLVQAFRKLPPTIAKKYMKQGMRRAIKPFLPEVQRNTPQRSGAERHLHRPFLQQGRPRCSRWRDRIQPKKDAPTGWRFCCHRCRFSQSSRGARQQGSAQKERRKLRHDASVRDGQKDARLAPGAHSFSH